MSELILAYATTAKSGTTCTASVNSQVVTVQVGRDLSVSAGDSILVSKVGASWFVIQRLYAAAVVDIPINTPAPSPKPSVVRGSLVVTPVETRSYRTAYGGWRSDNSDVYQGEYGGAGNHTGCAFYGSKPRSLAGASVTDAKIRVRRSSGGVYAAQTTTMRLMTNSSRPGGTPTLTSSTTGPSVAVGSTNDAFDVPNSWVQEMVDGTAGGLAFFVSGGSPYVRLAGRGSWSPAFTLTIYWQRG
jgi:hypothetical protein